MGNLILRPILYDLSSEKSSSPAAAGKMRYLPLLLSLCGLCSEKSLSHAEPRRNAEAHQISFVFSAFLRGSA